MQEAFNNSESVEIDLWAINSRDLAWNKSELSVFDMWLETRNREWQWKEEEIARPVASLAGEFLDSAFFAFYDLSPVINDKHFPPLNLMNFNNRIFKDLQKDCFCLFVCLKELVRKWSRAKHVLEKMTNFQPSKVVNSDQSFDKKGWLVLRNLARRNSGLASWTMLWGWPWKHQRTSLNIQVESLRW